MEEGDGVYLCMEASIYLLYCTGLYVFVTMGQYGGIDLFIIIRLGICLIYLL
jgi:hypothetical protein